MKNKTNRRSFIKSAAIASGGIAFAASLKQLSWAQPSTRPFSFYDQAARQLLARMTLAEKIGQMTQGEQNSMREGDIEKYSPGSLLCGGSSDPKAGNSLEAWTDLYDGFQRQALKTRLAIPILFGVDAVHGHNNVLNAVVFPHNIGLGCTRNPALVEKAAQVTAEEVRATGFNWAFAPCI
ncbi:MAG TPA: glycoside hydrolase family 3 N-terminal domain-containing protein, partial [Pyrinomonadaceae bacterium]|nr:glycoside hydrolase family 3 N-terminal domain-containing protein [Pyrinomonadaceae bacterium]